MFAMVSNQGTAMAETALCDKHYAEPYITFAKGAAGVADDMGDDLSFHDVSENDALECFACHADAILNQLGFEGSE